MTKGLKMINKFKEQEHTRIKSISSDTASSESVASNINLLESLHELSVESDSEETSEELLENPFVKSLTEDMGYFDNFLDLPDINSISQDISMASIVPVKEAVCLTKNFEDFVLTKPDFIELIPKEHLVNSEENFALKSQQSESNFLLLSKNTPEEELTEKTRKTIMDLEKEQTENILETIFESNLFRLNDTADEINLEALLKEREAKKLHQQILEFFNGLVKKVIEKSEFPSTDSILRQNLDKRKLLVELFNLYRKSEQERKFCNIINRKVVDFYKRKNCYHPIKKETANSLSQAKEIYLNSLKCLDAVMARKRNVEDALSATTTKLNNELELAKEQIQNSIFAFEGVVKKHLCKAQSSQWNTLIESLLKVMAKYRKEVSDVRFKMIIKQHTHAYLLNEVSRFEDLGTGVTLKHYDHLETANQILSEKIEERNADLNKLHRYFCRRMHCFAHLKEKQNINKDTVSNQSSTYKELLSKHSSLRKNFLQLKLKSSQIRQEMKELSIQNGLLDKPALMYDYDQTMKYLSKQHKTVNSLRATLETIQEKIYKLEKRLTGDNHSLSNIE